jgi:hypothetical protein
MLNNHKRLLSLALVASVGLLGAGVASWTASESNAKPSASAYTERSSIRLGVIGHCKYKAKRCNYFSVGFRGGAIKYGSRGTVCWLGNCRSVRASVRQKPILTSRYAQVGPYRCGSKTRATLYFNGKVYVLKGKISCLPIPRR